MVTRPKKLRTHYPRGIQHTRTSLASELGKIGDKHVTNHHNNSSRAATSLSIPGIDERNAAVPKQQPITRQDEPKGQIVLYHRGDVRKCITIIVVVAIVAVLAALAISLLSGVAWCVENWGWHSKVAHCMHFENSVYGKYIQP